jgi:hypothetical protein
MRRESGTTLCDGMRQGFPRATYHAEQRDGGRRQRTARLIAKAFGGKLQGFLTREGHHDSNDRHDGGAYIVTRMLQILFRPDESWVVKFFAIPTLLVALIGTADLVVSSVNTQQQMAEKQAEMDRSLRELERSLEGFKHRW